MPCDAIATCRARVAATQPLKALTQEQIGEVIKQYLEQHEGFEVASVGVGHPPSSAWVFVRVKNPPFMVRFNTQTGEAYLDTTWGLNFDREKLLNEIVSWVGQVSGVAYQGLVAQLLSKVGPVSSVQRTEGHHSALVVKMRLGV
jgi:hypothetical protein